MWRVVVFLFIMLPFSAFAECVSVDRVTKCARLPSMLFAIKFRPGDYTDNSWRFIWYPAGNDNAQGHYWSGGMAEFINDGTLYCYMDSPFKMTINAVFDVEMGAAGTTNPYEACSRTLTVAVQTFFVNVSVLDNDACPDGFFTVPYELSCGEGMVDTADVPQCDSDTSGEFCLIGEVPSAPCAAGITTIRTGTGVSVSLWAEKSTSPSLCVKYNDTVCYANLEAGQATSAININYNGAIYHTVD